jgi:hypothetical protein
MYPIYHNAPDFTTMHQSDTRAQRDAIRRARRARSQSETTSLSLVGHLGAVFAAWGRRVLHPRSTQPRPAIRTIPAPRS